MVRRKIREAWLKIEEQLNEARNFLKKDKIDEALYFIWIAAENIINSLKTTMNGFYLKDHRGKSYVLKEYYALSILKKDYSKTFEKLSKYRIAAGFHPYTSIPKDYTKEDVIEFLREIEGLKEEVEEILKDKGVLK
jgi:uncharacterized protein (UPF0332 family)